MATDPDSRISDEGEASRVERRIVELQGQLDRIGAATEHRATEVRAELETILEVLNLIHDDDPRARERLHRLRAGPDYEPAFETDVPLVSVVIPTSDRTEMLLERSIPSALSQTHRNIEVIVVGDASPAAVGEALASLGDPRVAFHNLTLRGPYPEDPVRAWTASGTPGVNAGVALARGLWIAPLGDDDAFEPDHVERLLEAARAGRLEFVYGRIRQTTLDGTESLLGEFPPRMAQIGLQAAIYHAGLRFMELELGHALFGKPNDWGLIHRMMRTGVRIGMVDEVTVNYWPSMRAVSEGPVELSAAPEDQRPATDAEMAAADLKLEVRRERIRGDALNRQAADLERRLNDVLRSRSWRITAPLRRLRRGA